MFKRLQRWDGRIALVTGASSGIGRATAVVLGRLGMRVAVTGRDADRLEQTATIVNESGGEGFAIDGDLRSPETPNAILSRIKELWGSPDVLINNAGVTGGGKFLETDPSVVESCFAVNLEAASRCIREAVTAMSDKEEAVIVNVSSLAAYRLVPGRGSAAYAASKHALRAFTEGVRGELAESKSRIRLCTVSPGLVDTEFHESIEMFGYRPLSPDDVAEAVVYILSTPPHVVVQDILLKSIEQIV
ncbi:MAG: SDR family NAD(P)-dependent oxidoreductase [Cyanothece sp. SIO1E1]|nr:SDR family NAD(P)-dependent oxidoreductase [Cyanothece sp. SIO1E1]